MMTEVGRAYISPEQAYELREDPEKGGFLVGRRLLVFVCVGALVAGNWQGAATLGSGSIYFESA